MRVSVAVRLNVVLGCLLSMLRGVNVVAMGEVRVMRGSFMVPFGVMAGGFAVVARSVLVVLRCLVVMMCSFVRHANSSPFHCVLAVREDYGHRRRWRGYRKANWV